MRLDKSHARLVFYSGGQEAGNKLLHEKLAKLAGGKARSLTYIPFSHENGDFYFRRIKARYKKFGFRKFRYFAVDSDFLAREMNAALKSDVIYLAGGNTYYFLKHLRESGFLKRLKRFVANGGVLAGLSAGAIIMTKNIKLAGYPPHEADKNEVRLKNLLSLGLVDFEFLPHYSNSKKTSDSMIRYSKRYSCPIFACPNGSGIVVEGTAIHFFGETYLFYQGRKLRLA
jgi:dipeptidase E